MANVGDKFIIELDSKMMNHNGFVYGVKDVPGLYVDDEIVGCLEKIEAYEKQKDRIEVGDEIFSELTKTKAVVQRIDAWVRWEVLTEKGQTVIDEEHKKYWQKTGRHFPQIAELLEEMRCEDERED